MSAIDRLSTSEVEPFVVRRIVFLLGEARSGDPRRDQTVTYAMRVISNYFSIGRDAGSAAIKRESRRFSRRAVELRSRAHLDWTSDTINDHPDPLNEVWLWIVANAATLSVGQIAARFKAHPMVVITKDEDNALTRHGYRGTGQPAERYARAGIEIVEV